MFSALAREGIVIVEVGVVELLVDLLGVHPYVCTYGEVRGRNGILSGSIKRARLFFPFLCRLRSPRAYVFSGDLKLNIR